MKWGEVRWYRFNLPDKRRPVLILTRDSAIGFLGELSVAPVTSTIREMPTEVVLTAEDGMPRECAVNLDHVQTVSKSKLGARLTTLGPHRMEAIRQALLFALGFNR